jgi:tetratricopeptide (TPR) repeat protein
LAELERQEGNPEKARDILVDGLKKCHKERSKLLLSLAWLEEDMFGRSGEAEELVNEALRIDGKNVRVYVAKANMELRMKRTEQARDTLRLATQFEGEDAQHYTMLSTLELEAGHAQAARRVLMEGAEKYPGDYFMLQRWGSMEAKLGNTDKARELFERSVRIQPHAPTFVAWAILEEELGTRAVEAEASRAAGGVKMEEFDSSLLDLPAVRDPAVAEMLGELSDLPMEDLGEGEGEGEGAGINTDAEDRMGHPSLSQDPAQFAPGTPRDQAEDAVEFASKQHKKARHLLSLGMVVDPQHGPLYHAYGNMELRHANVTGARDVFMSGIARNCSDMTSIYHAWGMLELREGRRADAADIFRRGIELGLRGNREVDNGVGFLLHSLGTLEADSLRVEEAEKVFSTGVNLFPQHSHLLLGLALVEMKLGKYDEAREHFKASVDSDPFHAHSWQSWALAEKQCGNVELARILFRQGLKKVPAHGALWQASAVMEMQQGNIDVARTLFAQALSRCPTHEQSYQAWACLEVRMGNLHKAKALALQGIHRAPNHPALWTVAALVEDRLGEHVRARKLLERGIQRFGDHGPLYKVLGEQHERLGDFKKARGVFEDGLTSDPHCAPLYHSAALLEARLGNLEGLHEMHNKAQGNLQASNGGSELEGARHDSNIIEKISMLVQEAEAGTYDDDEHEYQEDNALYEDEL